MNEWIKATVEYPKLNENILLTDGEKVGFGYLRKIKENTYFMSNQDLDLGMITHWMPLPEPPR